MFKNYFKIAVRNLAKHKLFSFINMFGLSAGMLVCIIALIDFNKAFQYDTFHPAPERTYRILTDMTGKENEHEAYASTPFAIGDMIYNYGLAETVVKLVPETNASYEAAGKELRAASFFTEASVFKVFGFRLLHGVFSNEPHTAVLTEETAKRFFGTTDVIGKVLHHKDWNDFVITGIIEMPLKKSHLVFDVLLSSATIQQLEKTGKVNVQTNDRTNPWSSYTYVLLNEKSSKQQLDVAIKEIGKQSTAAIPAQSNYKTISYRSQRLDKINPSREDLYNFPAGTTYGKLLIELGIGLITLLLAGFNYVNLTLARSLTRAKEIGVRKVIGASRKQIFTQFIVESVLISTLAFVLALCLLQTLKPIDIIRNILQDAQWTVQLLSTLILFMLLTGILAGAIPARILSASKPVMIIKGEKAIAVLRGLTLRKTLVVLQFAISLTGMFFMLVMYKQMSFMATGDYGFATNGILNIQLYGTDHKTLSNEIQKVSGVETVTVASFTLGTNGGNLEKVFGNSNYTQAEMLSTDSRYLNVMDLKLIAGDNFLQSNNDSAGNTIVINEQAAQRLFFKRPQAAVGQLVKLSDSSTVRISGVVKDFHSMSMFFPILPLVIRYNPKHFSVLQVKVNPGANRTDVKNEVEKVWKQFNPHHVFTAQWFDKELYDSHFHGNDQLMLALLCGMVICIACLGLLGMVTYTAEIRTKEVGVRKVLGATVSQLLVLLSRDFIVLLLIAALIAMPCGYIVSSMFLQNFTYHVTIGAVTLLCGLFTMLFIGCSTVMWQTYKVATHNPVKSLRTE